MGRFGRYEVVYELGRGAMAAVYQARDPVLTRFVAVKVLHRDVASGPQVLQRFFNEAKTVANVRNPHVVEVFDFGKEGREYFLVMEFVDGQSLHGLLKQLPAASTVSARASAQGAHPEAVGEPLDPVLTAALVCQAAEGLEIAARYGVVHRDIKPENLMINQQGYLKVADFGIAHLQDESLTRTGAVLGSPLYMSPEQVRGVKNITSQSDMFSLGAVLYRCLAGHPPFASANITELFKKIAREAHVPLWQIRPELDPTLLQLSETLLQKDPARRGGGPRWLRGELRNFLMNQGIADPMELVGAHLQELAARGVQTTWRGEEALGLPRTVMNTRPLATEMASRRAAPTVAARPRRGLGLGWALAGVMGMAVVLGGGYAALKAGGVFEKLPNLASTAHTRFSKASAAATDLLPAAATPTTAPAPVSRPASVAAPPAKPSVAQPAATPQASTAAAPAVAAETPRVETTRLQVQSSPPFAEIYLDGHYLGISPVDIPTLALGRHRFLIKGRDAEPLDTQVVIDQDDVRFKFKLRPRSVATRNDD